MKKEDLRLGGWLGGAASSMIVCAVLVSACSGANNSGLFGSGDGGPSTGPGSSGSHPSDPNHPNDPNHPEDDGGAKGPDGCTGIECDKPACKDGETTTLRGKVYDPAGANVLYGVRVFVPNGPLPALSTGASCDSCGPISPSPVSEARTDANGEFELQDVPVGAAVPVVVQTGKWRRKIDVAITKKCQPNDAADKTLRLPKNGSEGDMPHIAVTAGGCDALECLLRGIGVDTSEFVAGASPAGHIHVFNGEGGAFPGAPAAGGSAANAFGGELWNSATKMAAFDSVLLSCECSEYNENKGGAVGTPGARQALHDYAAAGGRVIATHYHYTWFKSSPQQDWQQLANWNPSGGGGGSGIHDVDTSFPRGQAFSDWLMSVNASTTPGTINLTDVTDSLSSVSAPAQPWIKKGVNAVRYFSFEAPIGGAACGEVAFTDLHAMGISAGGQSFPSGCPSPGALNPQQKALEFLLFDLATCK